MQLTCSSESSQDVSIAGDEHVEAKAFKDESEEKFREIIKRLIAQKQGEIQSCKDLLEAFHVLDSEEESLLKKKVSHEDSQSLGDSKRVVEEEQEAVLLPKRKCNFFSKKWRSEERKRNRTSQVTKTIVVLRPTPNSLDVDSSSSNKSKTGRIFSRFIIGLLKRRLQASVGKKSCDVHVDKSHCVQEKIQSKSGKHVSDEEEEPLCSEGTSEDSKKIMSGLYIAARKHLSEMLANGDIDVNLPDKEVPRILGQILSLPEFSSPGDSPSLIPTHDLVSTLSQTTEVPEMLQCSEDSDKDDETLFTIDVSVPTMLSDHVKETEKTEIEPIFETTSSSISRQEDGETATDVQGKLSPVSVLETLFTDDESSPTTSTRFNSGM